MVNGSTGRMVTLCLIIGIFILAILRAVLRFEGATADQVGGLGDVIELFAVTLAGIVGIQTPHPAKPAPPPDDKG